MNLNKIIDKKTIVSNEQQKNKIKFKKENNTVTIKNNNRDSKIAPSSLLRRGFCNSQWGCRGTWGLLWPATVTAKCPKAPQLKQAWSVREVTGCLGGSYRRLASYRGVVSYRRGAGSYPVDLGGTGALDTARFWVEPGGLEPALSKALTILSSSPENP